MQSHQWLAWVIAAMWLGQAELLWPLPSALAGEMSTTLGGQGSEAVAQLAAHAWLSWVVRIVLISAGVASAGMLFRRRAQWRRVFLLAGVIFFVWFQPWIYWIDGPTTTWMMRHPGWLFSTLIFPLFIAGVGAWVAISTFQHKGQSHAI